MRGVDVKLSGPIQRDPGGLAQGFVDLDLWSSPVSQQNLVPDHLGHAVQSPPSPWIPWMG